MQLKYPAFPTRVTPLQASWMVQEFCYVYADAADSYEELIGRLSQPDELAREDRVVQFPFTVDEANEKTEEELARAIERKKESGRRLLEQAQKMRLEKVSRIRPPRRVGCSHSRLQLVQKENDLEYYSRLKEWKSKERKTEYLVSGEPAAGSQCSADLLAETPGGRGLRHGAGARQRRQEDRGVVEEEPRQGAWRGCRRASCERDTDPWPKRQR